MNHRNPKIPILPQLPLNLVQQDISAFDGQQKRLVCIMASPTRFYPKIQIKAGIPRTQAQPLFAQSAQR